MIVCVFVWEPELACVRAYVRTTGPPGVTEVTGRTLRRTNNVLLVFSVRPADTQIVRRRPEAAAQERYMERLHRMWKSIRRGVGGRERR